MKQKNNTVFLILLCLLFSACNTKNGSTPATGETQVEEEINSPTLMNSTIPAIGDGGLFSEEVCKPPCLWGITPGITSESEAWQLLEAKEISQACHEWDNTIESGTRGIKCEWINGSVSIGLESEKGGTRFIGFTPSNLITIDQVVEKYGNPSHVAVWEGGIPENVTIGVTIFYDAITTRLDFIFQDGWVYELQPDAMVTGVSYLSEQEYLGYIHLIEGSLYEWKGYGAYQRK